MIEEFAQRWVDVRHFVEEKWRTAMPHSYSDIWTEICWMLASLGVDPSTLTFEMRGEWEGDAIGHVRSTDGITLWHTVHGYGSCSGCDAFEAAMTPEEWWTIGLHMVQAMREGAYTPQKAFWEEENEADIL